MYFANWRKYTENERTKWGTNSLTGAYVGAANREENTAKQKLDVLFWTHFLSAVYSLITFHLLTLVCNYTLILGFLFISYL